MGKLEDLTDAELEIKFRDAQEEQNGRLIKAIKEERSRRVRCE